MAKTELYPDTQEYIGWKELQKNYDTNTQTKGETSSSREETFRLGLAEGWFCTRLIALH